MVPYEANDNPEAAGGGRSEALTDGMTTVEAPVVWRAICFKNKGDFIAGKMPPFFLRLIHFSRG